jgi:cell division protein FtsI (penicillin-binding protein 3)
MKSTAGAGHPLRYRLVLATLLAGFGVLAARAMYLQVWNSDYLREQGDARHLRVVEDASHRGMIVDRNGEPLAISTPVDSVWVNPAEFSREREQGRALSKLLGISYQDLSNQLGKYAGREFMYLKRQVTPDVADRVMALQIPGVALQREYRRYYPAGAVASHVVGFTNVDDHGQEGLELAYDAWLRGVPGRKRVLKDRFGNLVEVAESLSLPTTGKDLVTSIDRRIQYLAYRELKAAVEAHHARAATAIVLDARTGEVLALVNEPSFNPNNRGQLRSGAFRNRAVTDVFEPGSTIKPFTIAAALESGRFSPTTRIDTAPGFVKVGRNVVHDTHNYGTLTLSQIIEKSSNVGASKVALALDKTHLWAKFRQMGFGSETGSGLPGESVGILNSPARWVPIEQASVSFGYGISVTALQLARAYAAIANGGTLLPVSLVRLDAQPTGERVMSETVARQIRAMLETVVSSEGTGAAARVPHYRVAGKTGTAHKLVGSEYGTDTYVASFVGFAPASDPRLVMVVMVDSPSQGGYYGGEVAAPVFARVMAGALRLMNVPPDGTDDAPARRIAQARKDGLT